MPNQDRGASLVAQLVKNPPAMQETQFNSWVGRSPGEGIGCPLQYSWASLVAQTVKNPPAMQETWVQPLALEDPLEEDMATHASIPAWRIPMDGEAWRATVHGARKRQTRLNDEAQHSTAPRHTFQKPFPCKRYNSGIQSGAKGPEWKASLQSTLAGQGSCVHAYPSAIPQG